MGHHRPQAKSLLVDLKLQGFINQIMSRVRYSKLRKRFFSQVQLILVYIDYEIIRSAKQSDGYSECNKYHSKWGLVYLLFATVTEIQYMSLTWCHCISRELQQWCSPSQRFNAQPTFLFSFPSCSKFSQCSSEIKPSFSIFVCMIFLSLWFPPPLFFFIPLVYTPYLIGYSQFTSLLLQD